MIYSWNPKTRKVFIPGAEVTIPQVKSFNDAKALVEADDFNPSDWAYIVKSKSGKVYNFSSYEDAVDFAKNKSTSRVAYTVFNKDKNIASFQNKKKLTEWKTIYTEDFKPTWDVLKRPSIKEWKQIAKRDYKIGDSWHLRTCIDIAPGKVRLRSVYMRYRLFLNNYVRTSFYTTSTTFHSNGDVRIWTGKEILPTPIERMFANEENAILKVLCTELIKLRPELSSVLTPNHDLYRIFARPCAFFAFDTYHNKCEAKPQDSLYLANYPREVVDESKLIEIIAKRMRIPITKGLKKIYCQNIHNMDVVRTLKALGFKDVNSYRKLVAMGILFMGQAYNLVIPFFQKLIKIRGENTVCRMVSNANLFEIRDTAQTYPDLDEEDAYFVMKNAANINEIHDTFNMILRDRGYRKQRKDEKIKYTKEELGKYNFECQDGISFILAEGSKDLAIVGANMGICVGSYADTALAKRTTIIKMMKGEKYIACIEAHKNNIVQIKAKFNNPVKAEYKDDIDEWLQTKNLSCKCQDYYEIGQEGGNTFNYAGVNPEDFEPHDNHPTLQIIKRAHPKFLHINEWFTENDHGDAYYTSLTRNLQKLIEEDS